MATALTSGATAPRVNRKVLIAGLAIALPLVAVLVANLGRDPHSEIGRASCRERV